MSDYDDVKRETKFAKPYERLTNVDGCRVIQVVEVKSIVGVGDKSGTPIRQITEYFGLDGERLARVDKTLDNNLNNLGVWADD